MRRHVFLPIRTIFELNRHIPKTHVLTKFYEDWTKNVTSRVKLTRPLAAIFSPIWTIFEHVRDIKTNVLTKFHDDWAKIVTSRVFTRNTAPPPWRPCFSTDRNHFSTQPTYHLDKHWASIVTFTFFEISRGINGTNVLTKFHEDRTINVASRVFTRQNVDDAQRTTDKRRSQKLTMSTLFSAKKLEGFFYSLHRRNTNQLTSERDFRIKWHPGRETAVSLEARMRSSKKDSERAGLR
ncbi:hypothetical protein DPMN_055298 [Dreissena polymorpha]|uniref:Uncharacterized protein n=1 Tax=Dreissena polymorpha TaxID=45954 RepID=A0A9D4CPQ3_DREPO|nr:hypothetical protein DPMN_055298 [Dreissena polymorpha]